MLASTVQFSTYDQTPATRPHQTQRPPRGARRDEMQTGPDTRATSPPGSPDGSAPSGPNSVPTTPRPPRLRSTPTRRRAVLGAGSSRRPNWSAFHPRALPPAPAATRHGRPSRPAHSSGPTPTPPQRKQTAGQVLLRKEVIQPHLPVRLPCYDFVPIADPAFDGSLPDRGWATGFGRYRLS